MAAGIKAAMINADCPEINAFLRHDTIRPAGPWLKTSSAGATDKKLKRDPMGGRGAQLKRRIRGCGAVAGKLDLDYVALLACDDDTSTGAKVVEAYIREHPETDLFYFAGGWAFFGPTESMPLYQEWCNNGGIAVSMDTFYSVLQAAKKGFAQALLGQDFRKMWELTVKYLVDAIKGLPAPMEYIDTGLELADESI